MSKKNETAIAPDEALSKADAEMEKRMGSLTGGMNIPGLF